MNTPKTRKKSHFFILSLSIFLGLLLHVAGIYSLKKITFQSYKFFITQKNVLSENQIDLQTPNVKKRNQDLSNIFNRLLAKNISPGDVKFNFKDLDSSFIKEKSSQITSTLELLENQLQIDSSGPATSVLFNDFTNHSKNVTDDLLPYFENSLASSIEYSDPKEETASMEMVDHLKETDLMIYQNVSIIDLLQNQSSKNSVEIPNLAVSLFEPLLSSSEHMTNPLENDLREETKRVIASSSDYMVNVEYAPQIAEEGYVFKLTLTPKPHKFFKRIRQNFFFLLDRSHSISSKNYEACKEAIIQSLEYLHSGDTFNILVFDVKVVKLSTESLAWNPKNIELAKGFLKNQKYGGFFATTDLYSSLDKIIPSVVKDDEVNTAILLSDGDTFLSKEKQRKTISNWTKKNKGKISLFSLAIGKKNNLPLLDLLSTFNKGSLRVANQPTSIASNLIHLLQALHSPIGKDFTITCLPHHQDTKINLYPSKEHLPNLYENLEYVLYGTIDKSTDFTIFLQGRYYDRWLDIKKSICLSKGVYKDECELRKGLTLQKAYIQYEQYLNTGHPEFLTKAKQLLDLIDVPLAF